MDNYTKKLLNLIPGGAHTYSRGFDQFPSNFPSILKRGKGAYVYDIDDNEYLDYGMALRANILGYAHPEVNEAVIKAIEDGNNLTRPSYYELLAAETFVELIDSADMVKFAKNGSNATSAATKLARAYTGRKYIARCIDHPFFSFDDWFIGSTVVAKGIPEEISNLTLTFKYNDIEDLENLFKKYPEQIACVIMEPAILEHPKDGYLHQVKELCHKNGTVFILDEMITGFRWHLKGAQKYYDVEPDLSTFGKAMANTFSLAAVSGKREIMQLGSIEFPGQERVFLLSTTHGGEMAPLAAFVKTVDLMKKYDVIDHIWNYGKQVIDIFNQIAKKFNINEFIYAAGVECSPYYVTKNKNGEISFEFRTLFIQEMVKNKVLMPWLAFCYSHGQKEFELTKFALEKSMEVYAKALEDGVDKYFESDVIIKPVFRKYN